MSSGSVAGGIAAQQASNDAKQPEDEDQDQNSAETDIHGFLRFSCVINQRGSHRVPIVANALRPSWKFAALHPKGIILPVRKYPLLLDFLAPARE